MRRVWFLFLAAAAGLLLADAYGRAYLRLDGRIYDRHSTVLTLEEYPHEPEKLGLFPDLRWLELTQPISTEAYDALQDKLPGCRILWKLDFQGRGIASDTVSLTLNHLQEREIGALDYLTRLKRVEAQHCRDYDALRQLQLHRPDCTVHYSVTLGGEAYSCTANAAAPGPCSSGEIKRLIRYLPRMRRVDLRGTGIGHADAMELADTFPGISFLWETELGGVTVSTDAREVDFSGVQMEDTRAVEELLPCFYQLEKVIMCDCGIPSPEMDALNRRYPKIRFVWRVKLGPLSARTDDTWFAPITKRQLIGGHDADELKYCTDMECIDLGHCWIRDCAWAANMPQLRYLVLADSGVRDLSPLAGLKNLAYLELFVTPVKDYSPLLGCTGLEDLNLGYTTGDPAPIAEMTWLKNLWWGGIHRVPSYDGRDPAALLRGSLPDTRLEFYAGSSTGRGWRNLPHYYEMRDRIGMYYMSG